jgi:hypothetical protein
MVFYCVRHLAGLSLQIFLRFLLYDRTGAAVHGSTTEYTITWSKLSSMLFLQNDRYSSSRNNNKAAVIAAALLFSKLA